MVTQTRVRQNDRREFTKHTIRLRHRSQINGSEANLPAALNVVKDPQGFIPSVQPVTSACTGCHVSIAAASHALVNTSALGESCQVCHGKAAEFSVGAVHAQY